MKGDFTEAVQFIQTFQNKVDPALLKKLTLILYKQKLYELLENPNQNQLRHLFEDQIVNVCQQDKYQQLFTLLTYRSVKEIQGLSQWTIIRGRYSCFEEIYQQLEAFFPQSQQSAFEDNLEGILESYFRQNDDKLAINPRRQFSTEKQWSISSRDGISLNALKQQPMPSLSSSRELPSRISFGEEKGNVKGNFTKKKKERTYIKLFGQPPRVQELQDDEKQQSIQIKREFEVLPGYLKGQPVDLKEESKLSFQYLKQNSIVEKDGEFQNFRIFQRQKTIKVDKIATINDYKAIRVCVPSKTNHYFALGSNAANIKIYSMQDLINYPHNLKPLHQYSYIHSKPIFHIDWSASDKALLSCSSDFSIKLTEVSESLWKGQGKTSIIGFHDNIVRMAKFNSNERFVVSCGDDELIKIWDLSKNKKCTILKGHLGPVSAFKFESKTSDFILYSCSKDKTVRMWDIRTNTCAYASEYLDSELTFISDNTNKVVVSQKNGCVSYFNSRNLSFEHALEVHEDEIRCIDSHEQDNLFLTASFDGNLGIFSQKLTESPIYFGNSNGEEEKNVWCTFMRNSSRKYIASTSTAGTCNIYSYT